MIEILNKQSGPIQLIVRSKRKARSFTTLVLPGRGKGKNRVCIPDEMKTEYIDRAEKQGLISVRTIN